MKVAIHQPNYLPWMGYFFKMYCADVFIFLDDVQFSKGSYINRVRILSSKGPRWLTVPVNVKLGQKIFDVQPSHDNWQLSHIDLLRNEYAEANYLTNILSELNDLYITLHQDNIAEINIAIVRVLASRLGIKTSFICSSEIKSSGKGDELLVNLVKSVAEGATYLSGTGGAKYQDPNRFSASSLGFEYIEFEHPEYDQGEGKFEPGLSVIDCLMRYGWKDTSELIKNNIDLKSV